MKASNVFRHVARNGFRVNVLLSFAMVLVVLLVAPFAWAQETGICIPIHAKIESYYSADGCDSPVELCTKGQITQGGILNGSTEFTALSVSQSAGMYGVEPVTTLSYSGELRITTKHGMLTVWDVGVFDTARGVFSELDRITGGTERFAGASGTLYIYGPSTADGSGFIGSIKGEICLSN